MSKRGAMLFDTGWAGTLAKMYREIGEKDKRYVFKESWELILSYNPKKVYYGHAKTAILLEDKAAVQPSENVQKNNELYHTVKQIMRYIDKDMSIDKIVGKLKVEREFVNDVCRMYMTHQNVGVQGILDRIEIKGR